MRVCDCCRNPVRGCQIYATTQIGKWIHASFWLCGECGKQFDAVTGFAHDMLSGKTSKEARALMMRLIIDYVGEKYL